MIRTIRMGAVLLCGLVGLAGCAPTCPDGASLVTEAGADQIVCTGQEVTLEGAVDGQPEGQGLGYAWRQTAGDSVTLSRLDVLSPTFTPTSAGSYQFRLKITTADGCASDEDAMQVTVLDSNVCGACETGGCCQDEHCDDGDACTADACTTGLCTHEIIPEPCGDGSCGECTETCENCPDDCGPCTGCGDGDCAGEEDSCNCPEDCGEVECCSNGDCDDGLFCNGVEICEDGVCESSGDPCAGSGCDEVNDVCIDPIACTEDADCDDGLFCNGQETCGPTGLCAAGQQSPCADSCNEATDSCSGNPPPTGCTGDAECSDGNACTTNTCVGGACQSSAVQCPAGQTCDSGSGQCVAQGSVVQAYDACFATATDTAVAINLRASADPYVENPTFEIVNQPASGALGGTAPAVTYTPNAGFVGSDTFTFRASDGLTTSATAEVTLFVGADEPECTGYAQCFDGAISPGGDTDSFTFDGAVSEVVTAYLDHTGNMSLRVSPPAGSGASDWFADFSTSDRQIDGETLPASGEYTITVDGSGTTTGQYSLCLLRQDQPVVPIAYDECEQRGIETQGDQDRFAFFGLEGEEVVIFLSHNSNMSLRLTAPAGATQDWFMNFSTLDLVIDEVALPADGEYTISVDGFTDFTGDYELCIEKLDPGGDE